MNTLNNILHIVPLNLHVEHLPLQQQVKMNNEEEKDMILMHIQQQINTKRQLLLQKQKYLNKMEKQNEFLKEVKNDYSKYYNYILKQKQEQMEALDILKQYVNDLTVSGSLSKQNIKDAKLEQKRILKEMKYIKTELDDLIEKTNTNTDDLH
jgi:hypothetical protein